MRTCNVCGKPVDESVAPMPKTWCEKEKEKKHTWTMRFHIVGNSRVNIYRLSTGYFQIWGEI